MDVQTISYFVIYLLAVLLLTLLSIKIPTRLFPFTTGIVDKVIQSNGVVAAFVIMASAVFPEFGIHTVIYLSPSEFVSVAIVFIDYYGLLLLNKNKVVKAEPVDNIKIKDQGLTIIKTDTSGEQEKIEVGKNQT